MKCLKFSLTMIYLFSLFSCQQEMGSFSLEGEIDNYDNHHIFIAYENVVDSALVKNGKFKFKGIVENPTSIIFTTSNPSGSNRNFYLENSKINVKLQLEKKKINDNLTIDWVVIKQAAGSKTDFIYTEFEKFKSEHEASLDWKDQLYSKLDETFKKYPSNAYSGDLLFDVSLDSVLTNQQLRRLYSYIDWKSQDVFRKNKVRFNIFKEENIDIGDSIKDFNLLNNKNVEISSTKYRGRLLLIDFWASWCLPCREEFPELKLIYNQYKNNGFDILGVSIDDSNEKWLKAIAKDKLIWENVISPGGFKSQIAIDYKIFAIPSNYLVNDEGVVIAKDMAPKDLELLLQKHIGDKFKTKG